MSKFGYFDSVNHELLGQLRGIVEGLKSIGGFYQSAVIYHSITESLLRLCIGSYLYHERDFTSEVAKRYYDITETNKFSILIDYFEIASGDFKLSKKLRDYNGLRNKLIHKLLHYKGIEELKADSKINLEQAEGICDKLLTLIQELHTVRTIEEISPIESNPIGE